MERGFVFLDTVLRGVRWDAKYATWDNFTGKPVEGYEVNRVAGSFEMATALLEAKEKAADHGFGLLLWDGYRPQRAVNSFLRWSRKDEDGLTKARYYPNIDRAAMISEGYVAAKSSHSRGSAIDLTLYRLDTLELTEMGTRFDFMDRRSHHGCAEIAEGEAKNRRLLRSVMESCGFEAYEYEWWHYMLKNEPYPDRYFDFTV
jgi:D-alanyl-D-alanine dipeptidase